jgi:hypothetical protein
MKIVVLFIFVIGTPLSYDAGAKRWGFAGLAPVHRYFSANLVPVKPDNFCDRMQRIATPTTIRNSGLISCRMTRKQGFFVPQLALRVL